VQLKKALRDTLTQAASTMAIVRHYGDHFWIAAGCITDYGKMCCQKKTKA